MPYPNYINFIASNEKVVPTVTNRPTRELSLRTEALKKRLDTSDLGQAIVLFDAPLAPNTVIGSPVYWNDSTKQFELAVAEAELNAGYMEFVKSERANCIGLVYEKESKDSGSIVLSGVVDLRGVSSIFDEPGAGRFFLGAKEGQLTHKLLGVCVPLGTVIGTYGDCDEVYRVCVNPVLNDLWSHLHYWVELVPKLVNTRTEEGWRPVDEQDIEAPPDAIYVYNIMPETMLAKLFPPTPIDACSIEIDWNDLDETVGGKAIPINCDNGLARVTLEGIYWTDTTTKPYAPSSAFELVIDDKEDGATWNTGDVIVIGSRVITLQQDEMSNTSVAAYIAFNNPTIDGWAVSVSEARSNILIFNINTYAEPLMTDTTNATKTIGVKKDPRIMREKLYMSKTQFANMQTCVTSLRPYASHPFKFVNCRGEEAYAGDLYAKFTLKDIEIDIKEYDGKTMRRFNDDYKQELTPIVNAIAFTGTSVSVNSNVDPIVIDGTTYYRGLTEVVINPLNKAEISPQIMKLGDALEREYNGIMYVGFPRDRESSILAKFEVPNDFSGTICFSSVFYSSLAGEYPSISCEYQIIHEPVTDVDLSVIRFNKLNWFTDSGTTVKSVTANSAFKLITEKIAIVPGDTVMVKLTRGTSAVSYAGDAGVIRLNGILEG